MRNTVLLSSFVLLCSLGSAQAPGITVHGARQSQSVPAPLSRQAIERHFEGAHPTTRPNLHGAVPGAQLIAAHNARTAALARRMQKTTAPSSLDASPSTVLPGLEMRPALGAGSYPTSVVTGDFNGDGHQDFVVANGNDNDLWIYLGKGDGTFDLPRIVPLTYGITPGSLVAADLRGNGILDLVVAEFGSSSIGVLLGNGDGTFQVEQEYALPEPPGALVVADFNHDGKPDIAAAMVTAFTPAYADPGPPYLAMLAGNGDGTFANPVITYNWGFYSSVTDLDAADVNGDGLPDLLVTGPDDLDNSTIYLNNGDGTFKQGPEVVDNDIYGVIGGKLTDLNGDGCPDAVVATLTGDVLISVGDCAGNFTPFTWVAMGQANAGVRVADVNGDGHLDLIASSEVVEESNYYYTAGNTISVAEGDGKGNFGLARIYGGSSEALSLAVGDFKGDGRPSIVTADIDTDTATVFPNDGNGGFGFPQGVDACQADQGAWICPDVVVGYGSGYTFADLNGDGKPDIFQMGSSADIETSGTTYSYYSLSFLNDGSGRFGAFLASPIYTVTTYSPLGDYKLGDFRNTGHLDLVAIGLTTEATIIQQVIVFQPGNGDGTFGKATETPVSGASGLIATGDFNGDRKLDFVAVDGAPTHTLTTFLGNGDGTFRTGASLNFSDSNSDIARVFTGDFNRDGKLDVLVFTTSNGGGTTGSAVWEFDGNGDGTFQPGRELFMGFRFITLADINNDGHPDIVRDDFFQSDMAIMPSPLLTNYLGQADGTFKEVSSYSPYLDEPVDPQPDIQYGDPLAVSVAGDYNGDGKIDEVAFQIGPTVFAQMLMGNGDGTFTPTFDIFPFTPTYYPGYGRDLDGDGFTDMVGLDWGSGGMMIQRGAPAPTLQMVLDSPEIPGIQGCGTVFPDLVLTSSQSVTLWSSVAGVSLPSSVSIPANATGASFCYTLTSNFDVHQVYDINASLNGSTATAYGSLVHNLGFSESLSSSTAAPVYPGESTPPIAVTLTAEPNYTGTINLSCDGLPAGYSCQFSPDQTSISPGSPASANLVVSTPLGSQTGTNTITVLANDGNSVQRQTLTVSIGNLGIQGIQNSMFYSASGSTASGAFGVFGIPPYSFSCAGLPAGASCAFDVTQESYPALTPVTVTITAAAATAAENYPLQLVVSSGNQTATAAFTLDVFNFTLQPPAASSDWSTPSSNPTVTFPVQASSNLPSNSFQIGCTLDSSAVCQTQTMTFNAGSPSVSITPSIPAGIAPGQHQLNVTTTFYAATQSFSFPYLIADFTGSLNTSAVSMNAGASTTVSATLNATTGFSDAVTFACSAPAQITCTLPSSTQLSSNGPQTVSVTLTAQSMAARNDRQRFPFHFLPGSGPLALAGIPFSIGLILRRRKFRAFVQFAICLCALCLVSSCGSGGRTGNGGGGGGSGNTVSYTVTISATASGTSDTHTLGSVVVTVNQ
jgi:hypothetical protein